MERSTRPANSRDLSSSWRFAVRTRDSQGTACLPARADGQSWPIAYVGSKIFVLLFIVTIQCILLFGMLKLLRFAGFQLPGVFGGVPQLLLMILTGIVGIGLGLFVSAVVKTSEMATSLVPLILIPQILFAGLVGVPVGVAKVVGTAMPATWAFDEM